MRPMGMPKFSSILLCLILTSACTRGGVTSHPAALKPTPGASLSAPAAVPIPSLRGDMTLLQMNALRDEISRDQPRLAAAGVRLVHWGPSSALRLVVVGVSSDVAAAQRILTARYGNVILVRHASAGKRT